MKERGRVTARMSYKKLREMGVDTEALDLALSAASSTLDGQILQYQGAVGAEAAMAKEAGKEANKETMEKVRGLTASHRKLRDALGELSLLREGDEDGALPLMKDWGEGHYSKVSVDSIKAGLVDAVTFAMNAENPQEAIAMLKAGISTADVSDDPEIMQKSQALSGLDMKTREEIARGLEGWLASWQQVKLQQDLILDGYEGDRVYKTGALETAKRGVENELTDIRDEIERKGEELRTREEGKLSLTTSGILDRFIGSQQKGLDEMQSAFDQPLEEVEVKPSRRPR
jgi:hypothetical protein